MKGLDLDLAARYDNYKNGFGVSFHNLSPKAALRFQPMKELLLRGSYGEGFRAPTLYENLRPFTSGNNTNSSYNDPVRCPNGVPVNSSNIVGDLQDECNVQQPTALQGDKNLKPEKSKQYSLGLVFAPFADLSMSVDYFNVTITDAIVQKSEIQVFTDPTAYQNSFYRYDPSVPAFAAGYVDAGGGAGAIKGSTNKDLPLAFVYLPYENTAKVYASGFDVNLNFKKKVDGLGQFAVNYDATYFLEHGYQYPGLPKASDNGAYKDFGSTPRYRHALTFTYGQGDWNASLTHNYSAGYQDFTDVQNALLGTAIYPVEAKVGSYETIDGQLGWKGIKGLSLVVGVKNLLDRDPPTSRNTQFFQVGYDAQYANPLGRTYYLRANYRFF